MGVHVDGIVAVGDGVVDIDVDPDSAAGGGLGGAVDVDVDVVLDGDVACVDGRGGVVIDISLDNYDCLVQVEANQGGSGCVPGRTIP